MVVTRSGGSLNACWVKEVCIHRSACLVNTQSEWRATEEQAVMAEEEEEEEDTVVGLVAGEYRHRGQTSSTA